MRFHTSSRRTAFAILLTALFSTSAWSGSFKQIQIDGSFDDWIGVPVAFEDPADSETSADYRTVWLANDEDFLYVRFTLERAANPFTATSNLFIDADGDPGTGFAIIIGSEMLIQSGVGYEERNGQFNEGAINALNWQSAPAGEAVEFEARISRQATFASDGAPVFTSDFVYLLLEAEDANFARQETAPDGEGLAYEFAPPPPPFTGTSVLVPLTAVWRVHSTATGPGPDWAASDFDDTQSGWSGGAALLGYTDSPGAYPSPLVTPLPAALTTHYLRTRFTWNNDSSGVVFVATNYLSDGAAYYLNGAEIRRTRLPEGALQPSTIATGSPATPGTGELFAVPAGPLVQGENVLAVEIHQSASTPADLVLGLSLLAAREFPVVLSDATQPSDRSVVGGASTSWFVDVIGSEPITYQWIREGQDLEGATNATLVIDPVLPEHAGTYSVRIANPLTPAGVVSRSAVLTVVSTPVAIVDQPAPVSVPEGRSATFTVSASGSAPLTYQWYQGSVAIPGATNATLVLPSVTLADAGDYAVEVGNPAPSSVRSQPARLTVVRDQTPPVILAVEGSPNQVVLTFSEPLQPQNGVGAGSFTVGGGLQVTAIRWDEAFPNVVTVLTSAQQLATRYEIIVSGVADVFGNVLTGPVRRAFVSTIRIDGSFDDWAGMTPLVDDPADAETATDYAQAWVTHDNNYLYLRVRLHVPSDFGIFYNNLFFNTDGDATTGFNFRSVGSDLLVQGGAGYQQKGGGFNEGTILGLDWLLMPAGVSDDFEARISRHAVYATDGLPVFTHPTIAFFLESENTSWVTVDVAPDVDPISYEFVDVPYADLGPIQIRISSNGVMLEWQGPGRLQSASEVSGGSWQEVTGATSPHTVSPAGLGRFYRLTL